MRHRCELPTPSNSPSLASSSTAKRGAYPLVVVLDYNYSSRERQEYVVLRLSVFHIDCRSLGARTVAEAANAARRMYNYMLTDRRRVLTIQNVFGSSGELNDGDSAACRCAICWERPVAALLMPCRRLAASVGAADGTGTQGMSEVKSCLESAMRLIGTMETPA